MKLLIIAGFLGSGKTTLLLQVTRNLTDVYSKIAIIENNSNRIVLNILAAQDARGAGEGGSSLKM